MSKEKKIKDNLIVYPATAEEKDMLVKFLNAFEIKYKETKDKGGKKSTQSSAGEPKFLRIDISIYGEDIPSDFPFVENDDEWCVDVDIATGKIKNWPQGRDGEVFAKVVDTGSYYLLDENNNIVAAIKRGYVPNKAIPPKNGYSDYIHLFINKTGKITNWYDKPDFSEFRWLKSK